MTLKSLNTIAINVLYVDRVENNAYSMATSKHKNPSLVGHEIYNFGRPSFSHHDCILNLSDQCPSVDKKGRRIIAFSLYDHAPTQELLPCGS